MGLTIQQLLIGDKSSYLDKFLAKNDTVLSDGDFLKVYLVISSMDDMLRTVDAKLESISNIGNVSSNAFFDHFSLSNINYEINQINNAYGFGSYFHTFYDGKFRAVSIEKALVNHKPIFATKHPVKRLVADLSKKFNYDSCKGFCNFQDFDYSKYLKNNNLSEKFGVKTVALNGHIHKNGEEHYLNGDDEFYFEEDFFVKNPKQISEFIEVFRTFEKGYENFGKYKNGFDYSHLMLSHNSKHYYYAEATALGEDNHHDRFGMIFELTPIAAGVSGKKASLVSFFECLNALKYFQYSVNLDNFDNDSFIPRFSNRLSSFFK